METCIFDWWWRKSSVSNTRRFTYFQILCYALERWIRTHNQILCGKTSWSGSRVHHNAELWTQLMVSQWNSSGIFSQDSLHCSSATKSKTSFQKMSGKPEEFQGRIIFLSMFNDIPWDLKKMNRNANLTPTSFLFTREDFHQEDGPLLMVANHKKNGTFGESGHPVFRATSPPSRGTLKSKGGG